MIRMLLLLLLPIIIVTLSSSWGARYVQDKSYQQCLQSMIMIQPSPADITLLETRQPVYNDTSVTLLFRQ